MPDSRITICLSSQTTLPLNGVFLAPPPPIQQNILIMFKHFIASHILYNWGRPIILLCYCHIDIHIHIHYNNSTILGVGPRAAKSIDKIFNFERTINTKLDYHHMPSSPLEHYFSIFSQLLFTFCAGKSV